MSGIQASTDVRKTFGDWTVMYYIGLFSTRPRSALGYQREAEDFIKVGLFRTGEPNERMSMIRKGDDRFGVVSNLTGEWFTSDKRVPLEAMQYFYLLLLETDLKKVADDERAKQQKLGIQAA